MTELWSGPIIDAHQHFWDPSINPHPWLAADADLAFRYGNYSAIKRRYLPDDYFADAGAHHVVQTVYIESEWDPQDPIGETRFIEQLARRYGAPNAIVAQAWLDHPDAVAVLAEQASYKCVRSVRHKPGGPTTRAQVGHRRSLMSDEHWRRSYAALQGLGLHFDLQTPWWNLHEAERLARDFPGTTLILNHAGLPSDRSAEGLAGWRLAMARLAEWPNVQVKISGLGQAGHGHGHGIAGGGLKLAADAGVRGEDGNAGALTVDLQLLDGVGALEVGCHKEGAVALALEPLGQLSGERGLTGTLEAGQHDDGGRVLGQVDAAGFPAEDGNKFLVDDLDDLLRRVQRLIDLGAKGAFADLGGEFAHHGHGDIGIKKGAADLAHRGIDIGFAQPALAPEVLESCCQPIR